MNRLILSTTLALAATPFAVMAEDAPENPNRFSFGPTLGLNFKANFQNSASYFNSVAPASGAGGFANHTYNDGYVLVDSSGNAGGLTINWGYQNASQVVGGTVQFHSAQNQGPSSVNSNPQYGAELVYQRVFDSFPLPCGNWGLETGFGYTKIDLRGNLQGSTADTTDSYALNGAAPGAGYNGGFSGPGNLLGSTPTSLGGNSAAFSGFEKLSGEMYAFRLGPFAEWNFTPELSLAASVGMTVAPTKIDYDYQETATLSGSGATFSASGHSSKTKFLFGPYVGATLRYDFTKQWGVYVGARFQNLTDLQQTTGTRKASFDPGSTFFGTVGASYHF